MWYSEICAFYDIWLLKTRKTFIGSTFWEPQFFTSSFDVPLSAEAARSNSHKEPSGRQGMAPSCYQDHRGFGDLLAFSLARDKSPSTTCFIFRARKNDTPPGFLNGNNGPLCEKSPKQQWRGTASVAGTGKHEHLQFILIFLVIKVLPLPVVFLWIILHFGKDNSCQERELRRTIL